MLLLAHSSLALLYVEVCLRASEVAEICQQLKIEVSDVIVIGLHGDGVPISKTDTSTIFSWNVAMPGAERIPFTAVSKRSLCGCGCRGGCTFAGITEVFVWSMLQLLVGRYPSRDHNEEDFRGSAGSSYRSKLAGQDLKCHALLREVRGAWLMRPQLGRQHAHAHARLLPCISRTPRLLICY